MWNELGWIYATSKDPHFRDPSKALEYAQKAVSLSEGKSPEILDTLAEAYYVNRDYDKAIETETKALKLTPDNVLFKRSLERYQRMKNGKT
jgi:tetratricopeptide (TPR) repeat protein